MHLLAVDYVKGLATITDIVRPCAKQDSGSCPSVPVANWFGKTIKHSLTVTYGLSGSLTYTAQDISTGSTLISYSATGDMGSSGSIKFGTYRLFTRYANLLSPRALRVALLLHWLRTRLVCFSAESTSSTDLEFYCAAPSPRQTGTWAITPRRSCREVASARGWAIFRGSFVVSLPLMALLDYLLLMLEGWNDVCVFLLYPRCGTSRNP